MDLAHVLAVLVLFVGVPLNVLVTYMLWKRSQMAPDLKVLRERFIVATAVLVMVFVFGLIFLNNDHLPPFLTTDVTKVITRFVMLGIAVVPATYWLVLYRGDRKR